MNPTGANQTLVKIYEETPNAIRVSLAGSLAAPPETDAIVASYPSATVETYVFKSGGVSGTTLMTLTVTYTTSSKEFILSVVKT